MSCSWVVVGRVGNVSSSRAMELSFSSLSLPTSIASAVSSPVTTGATFTLLSLSLSRSSSSSTAAGSLFSRFSSPVQSQDEASAVRRAVGFSHAHTRAPRVHTLFYVRACTEMSLHRIFVYGTLKRGKSNHHLLGNCQNGLARLLGSAKLAERYPLVLSSDGYPVLLDKKGSGMQVEGELYEVDDQMLRRLDALEHHPELYTRSPTRCQLTDHDGTIEECEAYIMHDFRDTLLETPFLACYDPSQESGKCEQSLWDMKKKAISK